MIRRWWYPGIGLTLGSALLSLFWGEELSLSQSAQGFVLGPESMQVEAVIVWWVRAPQLVTALVAGAALALSGAAMQTLMRNELADPYLMGVASGGGLGAALALSLGIINLLGLWALPCMSFIGALFASVWVELYARRFEYRGSAMISATHQMILAGVALNLFLSALLTLTLALSEERLGGVWRWLIGHVHGLSWAEVGLMCLGVGIGSVSLMRMRAALSLMRGGEEIAWSLGVPIRRVRSLTLISISLAVGAVVSYCGVIGFIGLLIPHFIRPRISGVSHHLFGLSALYGAGVLCLCDLIARLSPKPMPVGVVTGVLGGAIFLYSQHKLTASDAR